MQAKSDAQLLREYAAEKSEPAFGEVVHRHADLVYSAAVRQAGSPDLAGEIAQNVFMDLARKARSLAGKLREDASLAGWLYRATHYAALDLLRKERRRQAHEREVMQELHSAPESSPDWDSVSPLLDEAISGLNNEERDALLLRFFKNQDFRAVGAALGVSDDTAQKRVARSLEKLRAALMSRGVTTTATALSAALASHAVQSAPAGLAAAWTSASLASATAGSGGALTLLKFMSMTKIQLGFGAVMIASLATTVAIQRQTASMMRGENLALRQQVEQIAPLQEENKRLSNDAAIAGASTAQDSPVRELARLRGEVGLLRENVVKLRQQTNNMARLQEANQRLNSALAAAHAQQARTVQPALNPGDECIKILRQIDSAKQQWALENRKKITDTPEWSDLMPYIGPGDHAVDPPKCPSGGAYTIGSIGEPPKCNVADHVLPVN